MLPQPTGTHEAAQRFPETAGAHPAYPQSMARRDPTPSFVLPFDGAAARAARAPDDLAAALSADAGRLRRVALRITRDAAAAEDAVQNALEKALRHRTEFRGEAKPSTWLHRITVNEALAWRRSEARRARRARDARVEAEASAGRGPLDELLARERRERVLRALAGLRAEDRELLARFALEGGHAGFARAAGLATTVAKTRAFRARRALRAALAEREG
jgi:RNA polymerase sigma-70 factor (ECF subfamily)